MSVIMITGGSGQLGRALKRRAWPDGVRIVAPWRGELDLSDAAAVSGYLEATGASAVINAAAYTAVDKAETDRAAAFRGNAFVPAALAEAAAGAGAALIHVSTDYVFDGSKTGPYEVSDLVAPINVYGASKAAGELAVRSIQPRSAVVRTSWLVSPDGANFVTTMLRLARERDVLRIVADQRGAPTIAADLADALAGVALRMIADEAAPTGVFHAANDGATDWAEFAQAIFGAAAAHGIKAPTVEPISTQDYPTPARRPKNSVLSTARLARDYGLKLRPWREALPGLVEEMLEKSA